MEHQSEYSDLHCTISGEGPFNYTANVIVPAVYVDAIYNHAVYEQRARTHAPGFAQGTVPVAYIEHNFKANLLAHLKDFLLNFLVYNFLLKEIRKHKLPIVTDPLLSKALIEPHQDAHFSFDITLFSSVTLNEWKHFPFSPPQRKNYKDLDRQVESFIEEEQQGNTNAQNTISIGDWVRFSISIVNQNHDPLLAQATTYMWIKMGDEEVDISLRSLFLDKKMGDIFYSNNTDLQYYFSPELNANHLFRIEILDVLFQSFFCLEQFKKCFKLKTNREMHQKLIEVFSYRNNLSQRRSMAEEALKLLLNKHRFSLPHNLVAHQQKYILNLVQANPDYHVYRAQKDFKSQVKQLAEKQAKEKIILDLVAYTENLAITDQDVKWYLNLSNRPRTKEFIYFDPQNTKIRGQEMPISEESFKFTCLREKALNYIIYHLTKR